MTIDASADGVLGAEGIAAIISEIRITGDPKKAGKQVGTLKKIDFAAAYQLNTILESFAGYRLEPTPITKSAANSPMNISVDVDFRMPWCQSGTQNLVACRGYPEFNARNRLAPTNRCGDNRRANCWNNSHIVICNRQALHGSCNRGRAISAECLRFHGKAGNGGAIGLHVDLDGKEGLRGVLIKTFTRNGVIYHTPVDTVINSVKLMVNNKPSRFYPSLKVMKAENQRIYGVSIPTGYAFLDFMSEGNFDTMLPLSKFGSVQLQLDVNAIANSVVKIYPIKVRS